MGVLLRFRLKTPAPRRPGPPPPGQPTDALPANRRTLFANFSPMTEGLCWLPGGVRFHVIPGLLRSGPTLLATLLLQTPRCHAGLTSPVGALLHAVLAQISASREFAPVPSSSPPRAVRRRVRAPAGGRYRGGVRHQNQCGRRSGLAGRRCGSVGYRCTAAHSGCIALGPGVPGLLTALLGWIGRRRREAAPGSRRGRAGATAMWWSYRTRPVTTGRWRHHTWPSAGCGSACRCRGCAATSNWAAARACR